MSEVAFTALDKVRRKDPKAHKAFISSFEKGQCKKGQFLHEVGRICNKMYVLESGITKQFRYKEDGSEYITWFGFAGDVVMAYKSFVLKEPSIQGIMVLEDCTYSSISRDRCYELAEKYHALETYFREMLEQYYIEGEERLFFLLALSARQKYQYLYKHHPHFIQKLPSSEISSFLGVTRETLSRIRNYG